MLSSLPFRRLAWRAWRACCAWCTGPGVLTLALLVALGSMMAPGPVAANDVVVAAHHHHAPAAERTADGAPGGAAATTATTATSAASAAATAHAGCVGAVCLGLCALPAAAPALSLAPTLSTPRPPRRIGGDAGEPRAPELRPPIR